MTLLIMIYIVISCVLAAGTLTVVAIAALKDIANKKEEKKKDPVPLTLNINVLNVDQPKVKEPEAPLVNLTEETPAAEEPEVVEVEVAEESEKVETEVFVAPLEAVEVDDSVEEVAAQENDLPYILAPDGTIVYVKYKRSYMSKIIQSKDILKERYSIIKNKLLTIKGVKNRVSWSCESFKIGHKKLAHITMKGKTLTLCLPFDPSEYADSKYPFYDLSDRAKFKETPFGLKVKSDRGLKYALELIDMLIEREALKLTERENENFVYAYEDDEALLDKELIKAIYSAKVGENDTVKKIDLSELFAGMTARPKPIYPAKAHVDAVVDEVKEEEDEDAVSEITEEPPVTEIEPPKGFDMSFIAPDGTVIYVKYKRSYTSKLIQGKDEMKERYSIIKNKLLTIKGVKNRVSWSCESFKIGHKKLAHITMKGKTLTLCLPFDPSEYADSKYPFYDLSDRAKFKETPFGLKVKSDRGLKYALELIDMLIEREALKLTERENENFVYAYEEDAPLLERELIKAIYSGNIGENDSIEKYNLSELFAGMTARPKKEAAKVEEKAETAETATVTETVEEIVAEEPVNEAPETPHGFDTSFIAPDGTVIYVKYKRSYTSKLIQGKDVMKERYSVIKNKLLTIKKIKNRTSWSCESFKIGHRKIAHITMKGKTLTLCLPFDPKEYEDSKYPFYDLSERAKFRETPFGLKVKSDRGLKYALELIDTLIDRESLKVIEREAENYVYAYEEDEALLERELIKAIYSGKVGENDSIQKINLSELFAGMPKKETVAEVKETETVVEQTETVVEETETEVKETETVVEQNETVVEQTETVVEQTETVVEETETVVEETETVVEQTETVVEETEDKVEEFILEEPIVEAVDVVIEQTEAEAEETVTEADAEEAEEAVPEEMFPISHLLPIEDTEELTAETLPHAEHIDAREADLILPDTAAMKFTEEERGAGEGRLDTVNIGEIDDVFSENDVVDIDSLKEKGLISKNAGRVKILADGLLNKPLTIKAERFSIQAIKMIELTGGKVVILK